MSTPAATTVVVGINVAPILEERVVDWLLDADQGFTSAAVYGHGSQHGDLSVAEQVSGRQKRVEFRVEIDAATLDAFVDRLSAKFAHADLYFYVTPVLRSGHLRKRFEEQPT